MLTESKFWAVTVKEEAKSTITIIKFLITVLLVIALKLRFFINLVLAMKRNAAAILLLTVFISLQFGKVASYIYCKWQAEIIQNNPDCGCDDHLTAMFDHNDDSPKNDLSKNTVNEKLNEFTPKSLIEVQQIVFLSSGCFTEYNAELSESFIDSPFHPPIA